jgi:hypothetical protein
MNPKIWGPDAWSFIHSVALNYPKNPTSEDREHYYGFYNNLKYILPCPICADNYGKHINDLQLTDAVLSSRKSLFNWTVDLHNKVNRMKGRSEYSYDRAIEKYSRMFDKSKRDLV